MIVTLEKLRMLVKLKVLSSEEMDAVRVNGASVKHGATYVALISGERRLL